MEIIVQSAVPHVDKKDAGTEVWYYLFPEHEIHYNEIRPTLVQEWHHHSTISEDIYVVSGNLQVSWIDEVGDRNDCLVGPGGLVRVGATVHTFSNPTSEVTRFVVFRFVPRGLNQRELIKNDKFIDDITK